MALALGGRRHEAERAYRLAGSRCSAPTARGTSTTWPTRIEQDKLDANISPTSPPACGTTGCCTGDRGFVETMWPVVERAIDFVLDLQTPAGRDPLGPPRRRHPVVVRPAHRLVEHLPQPALRHRDRRAPRPRASRLGALSAARLAHVIRPTPRRPPRRLRPEAPLGHGLVLPGARRRASAATAGRERLDARRRHVLRRRTWACAASATARGSPRPRPASACSPTSPSATATRPRAVRVGPAAPRRRRPLLDRHRVPRDGALPRRRARTYTAASIVLAADALRRHQPGLGAVRRPRRAAGADERRRVVDPTLD